MTTECLLVVGGLAIWVLSAVTTLLIYGFLKGWTCRRNAENEKVWERIEKGRNGDLFRLLDTKHAVLMLRVPGGYYVAATRGNVCIHGGHSFVVTTGDPVDVFDRLADIAFNCGEPVKEID